MTTQRTAAATLVRPPAPAPGVCGICRDSKTPATKQCDNCSNNTGILGTSSVPVRALTLYTRTCPIRDVLTGYKNPLCEQQQSHEAEIADLLRRLLGRLRTQRRWDAICVVPSSNADRVHPMHVIVHDAIDHRGLLISPLRRGPAPIGHGRPHPDGYTATVRLDGRRVLIVDDVYTTGARSQSAAHALVRAGATITTIAVIGRRINPDATPELAEWSQRYGLTT